MRRSLSSLRAQAARESQYSVALPGYRYEFRRDHFDHPEYQTEWWYYTGNVKAADGRRFGFELTFFRQGVDRDKSKNGAWDVRDLYLAHLALSDLDGGRFYHTERTNRAGPGIAGVSSSDGRIWNGNWQIQWKGDEQSLRATDARFELQLALRSEKPPVIQGENGVSQKADGAGHASHYISLTHLATSGTIVLNGKSFQVSGLAWMDHEFFTHQLESDQIGWDWFSIQLDGNTEIMLFRIRRKDGSIDPFSSAHNHRPARTSDTFTAGRFLSRTGWPNVGQSGDEGNLSGAMENFRAEIFGLELELRTPLPSQELTSGAGALTPSYWEGSVTYTGTMADTNAHGVGYLEMTGYDHPFELGSK